MSASRRTSASAVKRRALADPETSAAVESFRRAVADKHSAKAEAKRQEATQIVLRHLGNAIRKIASSGLTESDVSKPLLAGGVAPEVATTLTDALVIASSDSFARSIAVQKSKPEKLAPKRGKPPNTHLHRLIGRLSCVWQRYAGGEVSRVKMRRKLLPDGRETSEFSSDFLDFACDAVADLPASIRPKRPRLADAIKTFHKLF